jgi:hypothetical protein
MLSVHKVRDSPVSTEYVIIHSEAMSAKILQDNHERGVLRKMDKNGTFELEAKQPSGRSWTLTQRVDGEFRPFSIVCYSKVEADQGELYLKIKDRLFQHQNNFYSVGEAVPAGASPGDYLSGSKYICRLMNFPYSEVDEVDRETRHQMRRHRGIPVGEVRGLGADGYHLKIYGDELADIGLLLTAATYLLYTTR